MNLARHLSNFMFGMECLGCGSTSDKLDPWLCPQCKIALSLEAKAARQPNEDTLCLYGMRPLTRRLIHALKYKSIPGMATYLVKNSALYKDGGARQFFDMFPRPYLFVPVPLHRARYRERGYNQAEKIAAAFATAMQGELCNWLKRKTFHVSQTKLSRQEREWNVAGAFSPRLPARLPARGTVFIVDDVFTTGSTTGACMSALGKEFPLNVKVCTLLYDEPVTAVMDYVADIQADWDVG